jgi:hypothetical protein
VNGDRLARVAGALAGVDGQLAIERLLELSVEMLATSGASVAVVGDGEHVGALAVAGSVSAEVDDLQFSLGEGPCIAADLSLGPVLEPDLALAVGQWPAFAPAALALGVAAAFAFPLRVGSVHLGVLTLYRVEPGDLDGADLADAVALARVATHLLLELEGNLPPGSLPDRLGEVVDHRANVHQATGMIAAQLGSDVATALGRLRAFAWSRDRSVGDVADDVVSRRRRFEAVR